jgi:hypothetical protein
MNQQQPITINGITYQDMIHAPVHTLESLKGMITMDLFRLNHLITHVQNTLDDRGLGWNPESYLNTLVDEIGRAHV